VQRLIEAETERGLRDLQTYRSFQERADRVKDDLVAFLIDAKRNGKRVGAYGAAAKGNTLLNYAGIKPDLLPFVCDAALAKQGKYLPGSHIPILAPDALYKRDLEFLLILPWNISSEIRSELKMLQNGDTRFVTAVPEIAVT
jgi:hypothetical protein